MQSDESEEIAPASPAELARFLTENARGRKQPVLPVGGRTSLRFGDPVRTPVRVIATSSLAKVVDYPARDMTITVETGIRVSELQSILAGERQRLPIDIPDSRRATLGGAIATNTSGPGRFGHGTFRDFVIGVTAVDGQGRLFSAGGRVVKNVAGYDLCKLLVGSMGTLAVLTQVTLKLRPLSETRWISWYQSTDAAGIESMLQRITSSATRPVAIEVLNSRAVRAVRAESKVDLPANGYSLAIAFEGSAADCRWQSATLLSELSAGRTVERVELNDAEAASVWESLVQFQAASDDPATVAASITPSALVEFVSSATAADVAVQAHAGNGIVIGHLPDRCVDSSAARAVIGSLRRQAMASGGSVVVWNCDDSWKQTGDVFGPPSQSWGWTSRVKKALDPFGVLSPGRLPL
jgi:glycolate oxidase FAD binding subunit